MGCAGFGGRVAGENERGGSLQALTGGKRGGARREEDARLFPLFSPSPSPAATPQRSLSRSLSLMP